MSEKQNFSTALAKVNDTYFPMIESQLVGSGINMDKYARQCVLSALSAINNALDVKGISWNNPQLDQSNITQTLLNVASLKLNAAASPREVYFQIRNVKVKVNNQDVWKKQIEMGIEGDGNDAILSRFGRDVKKVAQFWMVREGDTFTYPTYNGLELSPPTWSPTGRGEVIRIVYPIIKNDDIVEYHIAEREDVVKNLIAHINNNLMNETFGIAKDRFKANAEQRKQINAKKQEILLKVKNQGLITSLDDPELQDYISPAWKDPQSRESMIIRKMRNNIVKKIPKDFGNAFIEMAYDETSNESYSRVRKEINENANSEVLEFEDIEPVEPDAPEEEPDKGDSNTEQAAEPNETGQGQDQLNVDEVIENMDKKEPSQEKYHQPGLAF